MTRTQLIRLAVPTNATRKGPQLNFVGDQLTVTYDYQESDGSVALAQIGFEEVLAVDCRASICCQADDILPADQLVRSSESPWLEQMRSRWMSAVGWQDFEQKKGGAGRFYQFSVYFDDVACVQVIASGVLLDGKPLDRS